jgi:hypothetical protein
VAPSICKKLALTSLTSGSRSVGIVHLRTQITEFVDVDHRLYNLNYTTTLGYKFEEKLHLRVREQKSLNTIVDIHFKVFGMVVCSPFSIRVG